MSTPYMTRPVGVIIAAILEIIIGIGDVAIGTVLLIFPSISSAPNGTYATALLSIDVVAIVLGIFSIVLAYLLWSGRRRALALGVIGAVIGIILGVLVIAVSLAGGNGIIQSLLSSPREPLVPIIVYTLILALLCTRSVRTFLARLGRVTLSSKTSASLGRPYVSPAQSPYPSPATSGTNVCTHCGAPNQSAASFCNRCGKRLS